VLQPSLFAGGRPGPCRQARFERVVLDRLSWVELCPGFLEGADALLEELVGGLAWTQRRRRMFDRVVDDPRLSCWLPAGTPLPHPALEEAKAQLESRYGVAFGRLGLNYYRHGRDSVAFHRDRELCRSDHSLVAVLTLGGGRPFLLRPRGGGPARRFVPASGDLLVMGGACQRSWEHSVPKVATAPARVSASWRWPEPPAPRP